MDPVIELAGLSVRFGNREILHNLRVSLSGRTIGLLRPERGGEIDADPDPARIRSPQRRIRQHLRPRYPPADPRASGADRLHAGERFVHREHDRRLFHPHDGRAGGASARRRARTRARSSVLRRTGRSALSAAGNLFAGHEAAGEAGAGDRPRAEAADSRRADQRPGSAGAPAHDPADQGNEADR